MLKLARGNTIVLGPCFVMQYLVLFLVLQSSTLYRGFLTFLKSGQGPVEIGKKAFGPSKLGNLMQLAILN